MASEKQRAQALLRKAVTAPTDTNVERAAAALGKRAVAAALRKSAKPKRKARKKRAKKTAPKRAKRKPTTPRRPRERSQRPPPAEGKPMLTKAERIANLKKGQEVRRLHNAGHSLAEARKMVGLGAKKSGRGPGRPRIHHHHEDRLVTLPGGDLTTTSGIRGLHASIGAHEVVKYNEQELGAIIEGFVVGMREPCGPDLGAMFPRNQPTELVQAVALALGRMPLNMVTPSTLRDRYPSEFALGKAVAENFGKGFVQFNISATEWAGFMVNSISNLYKGANCAVPLALPPSSVGDVGQADASRWISPLAISSRVTDGGAFNTLRESGVHRGVDLAAAIGTPVVAPRKARVVKTGFDADGGGGNFIHVAFARPDGTVPMDTIGEDDTDYRGTFMHLSAINVSDGDIVERGQQIGLTGNTGSASHGPHLHMSIAWFEDRPLINERYFVDPLGLIPVDVIEGRALISPSIPPQGQAIEVLAIPAMASGAQAAREGHIVISGIKSNGDLNLTVNTGPGTTTSVPLQTDVGIFPGTGQGWEPFTELQFGTVILAPPNSLPPIRRLIAASSFDEIVSALGGTVVTTMEGAGNLLGRIVNVVATPEGLRAVVGTLAGSSTVAGPALQGVGAFLSGPGAALAGLSAGAVGNIFSAPWVGPIASGVVGSIGMAAGLFGGAATKAGPIFAQGLGDPLSFGGGDRVRMPGVPIPSAPPVLMMHPYGEGASDVLYWGQSVGRGAADITAENKATGKGGADLAAGLLLGTALGAAGYQRPYYYPQPYQQQYYQPQQTGLLPPGVPPPWPAPPYWHDVYGRLIGAGTADIGPETKAKSKDVF